MLSLLRTGALITAVLTGTVACALIPPDLGRAADGWTPTPSADDADLAAAAHRFCIDAHDFVANPAIQIQDQRGPDGAAFLWRDGNRESSCFVYRTHGGAIQATGWNESTWGSTGDFLIDLSTRIPGGPQWASGPTGIGAATVDIELPDGTLVSASVVDGYFLAWWPGSAEWVSVVSRDVNGVPLEALPTTALPTG